MSINNLSFRDLEWIVGIRGVLSLRDFARLKQVQVAHASKVFQNIEHELKVKLFHRSPKGIEITDDGAALIDLCEELLTYGDKIRDFTQKKSKSAQQRTLTIGALAFLQSNLTIHSLHELKEHFRILEINPNIVPQLQLMQEIDIFIHLGKVDWPSTIQTVEIGKVKFDFFMHQKFIKKGMSISDLYRIPFILPTYLGNGRFIIGNDRCPIPMHLRCKGDESTTAQQAVQLLARNRQIAFLPEIVVRGELKSGSIQKIRFTELPQVCETLYLSVKVDRVSQHTFTHLTTQLKKNLG